MIDATFLAGLRAWAAEGRDAARGAFRDPATWVSGEDAMRMIEARLAALDALLTARLATERARLLAAVADAESRLAAATAGADASERDLADERPDGASRAVLKRQRAAWDREEDAAMRALEAARAARANFDEIAKMPA